MADPASYRPEPGTVPDSPGVYRFHDAHGRVLYVGKAKSLRARLNQYFADPSDQNPRTRTMLDHAAGVDWTVVETEVAALQLEYSWIKEFDPRYNVRYRDDKSYPRLAVTLDEEYPRLVVTRQPKRKGVRYFGPYAHAWAIRETLDLLLRVFPARTCSAGVFKRARQVGRPCLLGYIEKCSAPCVGRVSAAEHRRIVEDFCDFMAGRTDRFVRELEKAMRAAAENQDYERAARLRDDLTALQRAMEKQAVVLKSGTDADVIALAGDELEAAVQVFYVRDGRVRGQRGWVVDKVEEVATGELVEQFLAQSYGDAAGADDVPREVLVPALPPEPEVVAAWLSERRGSRVSLRVPQRGDKRALLDTVSRNAGEALARHKTRRASDLTTRSRALSEIQDALGLPEAPLRIECYDVSNLRGSDVVGSMVVFEDGLPTKREYRRFTIKGASGQDDVRALHEVLTRRFRRYLAERPDVAELDPVHQDQAVPDPAAADGGTDGSRAGPHPIDPQTGKPRKFAYPPNLVVVDGGPAQVAAARRALDELGIEDVSVCGLAKRLEEVWVAEEDEPAVLARNSEGLYLLQRVRDEAHRFALAFHRNRRSRAMTTSALEGIPGLGERRRKMLLRRFGSVRRLKAASVEEIAEVPGIGPRTAQAVVDALGQQGESR